jgi:hypothetical protein
MPDPIPFVHDVGYHILGAAYDYYRPAVDAWAKKNPDNVAWLNDHLLTYGGRQ